MKMKIVYEKKNPLLDRDEIGFEASDFAITPSRKQLRESIAGEAGKKQELLVIGRIKQWFGQKKLEGTAMAYNNDEALKRAGIGFFFNRTEGKKKEEKKAEK